MRRLRNHLWWRWMEWRADRDKRAGRVETFDTAGDAMGWLRQEQFRSSAWVNAEMDE